MYGIVTCLVEINKNVTEHLTSNSVSEYTVKNYRDFNS